jgi:hypothetical protein
MYRTPATPPPREGADFWRGLLHRWFVLYNPTYLVSAALVLGGMITASRALSREDGIAGPLGVALVAELYACALIGGAALLVRIGQRRPAVLLALLTVLYQSDLTLHTETCAFLGTAGAIASAAWLALFVGKLFALAWALRLRLSRRAVATASLGALGLAVGPYLLASLSAARAGAALALFVFALGSLYPRGEESAATSLVSVDDWSRTVLRRAVRATWVMWAGLLALHVLFWSTQRPIQLGLVVPAFALLATSRLRSEPRVWAAALSTMVAVFVMAPLASSMCALLATLTLARHALPLLRADREGGVRLLGGAVFAVYLAAWTFDWSGGALPAHVLALDGALLATVLLMAWRLHARLALAPLAATLAHGALASGLVPPPRTPLEWGGAAVALGFALLGASLAASYRLRHFPARGRDLDGAP